MRGPFADFTWNDPLGIWDRYIDNSNYIRGSGVPRLMDYGWYACRIAGWMGPSSPPLHCRSRTRTRGGSLISVLRHHLCININ